jgi:hypothetical protein
MRPERDEIAAIFEAARRVKLTVIVARFIGTVKFHRNGAWLRAACPLCGSGRKGSAPFAVNEASGIWWCHSEDDGGDGIKLVAVKQGCSRLEAAVRIIDWTPGVTPAPRSAAELQRDSERQAKDELRAEKRDAFVQRLAAQMWNEGVSPRGTIVEVWFATRALDIEAIPGGFDRLRFHPAALAAAGRYEDGREWQIRSPAMLARVETWSAKLASFRPTALHCTYLRRDGKAKARLIDGEGAAIPARKAWGELYGGAALLTPMDAALGPLAVGEGIETVFAYAGLKLKGQPHRAAAALNLGNLTGKVKRDAFGCFDPAAPVLDPSGRAVFTFPGAGAIVPLIDRDMAPVESKVRDRRKKVTRMVLAADDRARLAASLVKQVWQRAGAIQVVPAFPPAGMDFNDAAIAERARG